MNAITREGKPSGATVQSPTPRANKAPTKRDASPTRGTSAPKATPRVATKSLTPTVTKPSPAARKRAAPATRSKPAGNEVAPTQSEPTKTKKIKVVRDSFTFPKSEYDQLAALKDRALALGISVKKGELLRCGLVMLVNAPDKAFKASIAALPKLKAGRPGK